MFSRVKPAPWMWTPNRVDPRARWMLEDLMIAVPLWRSGIVDILSLSRGNTQLAPAVPTSHANVVTRTGQVFEKTGTDVNTVNIVEPLKNAGALVPSTELTAAVCLTTGAGNAVSSAREYWKKNATPDFSFQIYQDGLAVRTFRAYATAAGGTLYTTAATAALASGRRVMAVLRVKVGETVKLGLWDTDTLVQIETVASAAAFVGTLAWTTGQYNLAAVQHQYECSYAWKRKLDDTEVQRLVSDPFGLFRQRARSVIIEPAAAGGGGGGSGAAHGYNLLLRRRRAA